MSIRLESALLMLHLAADLLSGPFHAARFLLSRGRQRAAFRRALVEAPR